MSRIVPHGQIRLAEHFVDGHHTTIRHSKSLGGWLTWRDGRFVLDETGTVQERAKRFLAASASQLENEREKERRCSRASVDSLLQLAWSDPRVSRAAVSFDASPDEINTPSGIIDLRTGKLRPHAHDDVTRIATCAPDATMRPQRFLRLLERAQPDPTVREYLQRLMGYAATGRSTEQAFVIVHGRGGTSKSTVLDVFRLCLGDYAMVGSTSLVLESNEHRTDVASLRAARFVYVVETNPVRLDAAKVKSLTGSDQLSARVMHGNPFTFTPSHTLVVATNHLPVVDGSDDALFRRVQLVAFDQVIPEEERELGLSERLVREEGPGILAWILEGAQAWYAGGLRPPSAIKAASRQYQQDEDVVERFLEDRCVRGPDLRVQSSTLLSAFKDYVRDEGLSKVSDKAFYSALRLKGHVEGPRSSEARSRVGLALRASRDESEQREMEWGADA